MTKANPIPSLAILTAALLSLFSPVAHAEVADANISNIQLYSQLQSNWCWAAVTQTIVQQNRGTAESQCQMASRFVRKSADGYCCYSSNGSDGSCNQGYYPGETLGFYGVLDQYHTSTLPQETLVSEIRQGYPVAFAVMWPTGGGHALLFYGASNHNGIQTVNIWDPANGGDKVVMSRNQAEYYQGGVWKSSYTTKCANNNCGQS